jgi:hypothetical protein
MAGVYPVWVVSGRKQEFALYGEVDRFPPAIHGDFGMAGIVVIAGAESRTL